MDRFYVPTNTYTDLSTQKALSRPSSSLPTSVSDILNVSGLNEEHLPQIIAEALIALIMFLPGTALSMAPLKDVTYRGELSSR
jgi:hypothetical protein